MKNQIIAQTTKVTNQRNQIAQALQKLYSLNIIHPKYQNLVAVTSFLEYFETGRCSTLEGHEGAYNIFEQEIRLDRIITKMDVIIEKLDQIKQSQYILYRALQESNLVLEKVLSLNDQMVKKLAVIQENTALTAYYSRCTAYTSSAIADIMVLNELLHN